MERSWKPHDGRRFVYPLRLAHPRARATPRREGRLGTSESSRGFLVLEMGRGVFGPPLEGMGRGEGGLRDSTGDEGCCHWTTIDTRGVGISEDVVNGGEVESWGGQVVVTGCAAGGARETPRDM